MFYADGLWGLSAVLWIATGLTRVLASMEKSTSYYMQNYLFWTKMTPLVLILVLEIRSVRALSRWRSQIARGQAPDTAMATTLSKISVLQALIVVTMVFIAAAMARGFGYSP